MDFRIFTLHPQLFESYLNTALVARGIDKKIIQVELFNWREKFGLGNYKQIDDSPFGGGNGMVLMTEPIFRALDSVQATSTLFQVPTEPTVHQKVLPNNSAFYQKWLESVHTSPIKKVTIMTSPRGFPLNQEVVEWLTEFQEVNILSGRYEGFDSRVSEFVDLEISLGNFVLNGGEVAAMCILEAVSRLLPGFVGKERSVSHDSFSSGLNYYRESEEFFVGKRRMSQFVKKHLFTYEGQVAAKEQLFDDQYWLESLAPQLEHPQYTRPDNWQNFVVPDFLRNGHHKQIQDWRTDWWKLNK